MGSVATTIAQIIAAPFIGIGAIGAIAAGIAILIGGYVFHIG
ncbi:MULTISPECIES: hypothetical protein [Williamsia]|uniref:Uncharacterized protein n=1 Tax=Williamsia herbipolensis TaxID=1603258 RepID=A0AAU4K625_9NOCA|nr:MULTISPECIES: hypothetical protein [Williamsia]MCX6469879.1 hypothetical protein [Mycobacteriales bacterium]